MNAPYEIVCDCGRTIPRRWPPGEPPDLCATCAAEAMRATEQLELELSRCEATFAARMNRSPTPR